MGLPSSEAMAASRPITRNVGLFLKMPPLDPNQGWVVRTTLYTSWAPAVTPQHRSSIGKEGSGRLRPCGEAIFGRANFLMKRLKRYWSRLHYSNKWRTSANQAMSHSSEIQP